MKDCREYALEQQRDIPEMERFRHLANCGFRFEKYAKFSKDPEFIKRMEQHKIRCFKLLNRHYEKGL